MALFKEIASPAFENHPLPSWILEKKSNNILAVNKAAVKTFGYSRAYWMKQSLNFFLDGVASRKQKTFTHTVTHKSGDKIAVKGYTGDLTVKGKKFTQLVIHPLQHQPSGAHREVEDPFHAAVVDSSIVTRADKQGTITYVNQNFCEVTGYTEKEAIGQNHRIVNSGYHPKSFWVDMYKVITRGKTWRGEIRNKAKDGTIYWVDAFIMPLLDDKGNVVEYLSIRNLITAKKHAEEELKRLALIAHHTSNAVILTDREGCITWVNNGFERTTGFTLKEAMGKKPGDLLHGPDTDPHVVETMRRALARGEGFRVEVLNYTKSCKPYWVDVEVLPLKNNLGETTGFMAIELDITTLKRAVFEMLKSQEQLQTIVNNIPMDVFIKDLQGRYTFYNRSFEKHLTTTITNAALTDNDLFGKQKAEEFRWSDKHILSTGETFQMEQDIVRNGHTETYYTVKFPLLDSNNQAYAVGGVSLPITERKQMERSLRENEERMRIAQEAANIGTWDWDIARDKIFWHGEEELLETIFDKKVIGYREFLRLVHEEDRLMVDLKINEALSGAGNYHAEFRVVRPNGYRWVLGSGSVIKNAGKPVRMIGISMDVTERKAAEENIRLSHELLQEINTRLLLATEAAHLGIWEWNIETGEALWNEHMYTIFGVDETLHDHTLEGWLKSLHIEDQEATLRSIRLAIDGHSEYHQEYRIIRPDGSIHYITSYAKVHRNTEGKPIKMIGIAWDNTEQKESERALKQSEARYRSIVDNQLQMICRYRRDATLTFVNRAYAEAFGRKPEELTGQSFMQLVPEENREATLHYIDQVFRAETKPSRRERRVKINGDWRWQEWFDLPLQNEQGEIFEIQSIGLDITHRKQLEAEQARLDKIVRESYNEIYLFHYHSLQFEFANRSALKNLGYTTDELNKLRLPDIFTYPDEMALQALLNSLKNGDTDRLQLQLKHQRKDGSRYDVDVLIQVMEKDRSFVAIVSDITAKLITEKKLLDTIHEKETLIKEIHHRVKNNLQLISSIIYLKMASLNHSDIRTFLENTRQKIRSIALIHERLLQSEKLDKVEISDYLGKLIHDIQITYFRQDLDLEVKTSFEERIINLDTAIICGLIVNELVTNAIKHAFTGRARGLLSISFKFDRNLGKFALQIADNGVSLPEHINPGNTSSFGMQLLDVFVKQLGGTFEIIREKGTIFLIRF